MKSFILYAFFLCLLPSIGFSQKEAFNWYFGRNAGLNFNSGAPVAVKGSLNTWEGCATMSDKNGNLLFYTEGTVVYDKNHQVMPNGSGLNGNWSSTQSAIIVPHVGNDSLYYIFTVDAEAGAAGLQYSIVNMKLRNGLGNITQKNVPLFMPSREKITAVRHRNNRDIWVIAHQMFSDAFNVYLIDPQGLRTMPVISKSGSVPTTNADGLGYMKSSPDGSRLAMANFTSTIELFDFDNSTGVVSNAKTIPSTKPSSCGPYGIEFSCDSRLLYVSETYACNASGSFAIFQFNLGLPDIRDVISSRVTIETGIGGSAGALQLGPDNRIYITYDNRNYLGTINKPGVSGPGCNFVKQSITLATGTTGSLGLPTFIQSYFRSSADFEPVDNCNSLSVSFKVNNPVIVDSVAWNFGDPASGNNDSRATSPTHVFSTNGKYKVRMIMYTNCFRDTVEKEITVLAGSRLLGRDTTLCEGTTLVLKPDVPGAAYTWQDGSTASTFTVTKSGNYFFKAIVGSCILADTVQVSYAAASAITMDSIITQCKDKFPLTVGQSFTNANYLWNTGATTAFISADTAGSYWFQVSQGGCVARRNVTITANPVPVVNLGRDTALCAGLPLNISITGAGLTYLWSNGSQSGSIGITASGQYWAEVKNGSGCTARDTVNVLFNAQPVVFLGNDTAICEGTKLTLRAGGQADKYIWQDQSSLPTLEVNRAGDYRVTVYKDGCIKSDTIRISLFKLPSPDLGSDLKICTGDSVVLNPKISDANLLWSTGATAATLKVKAAGLYSITATNTCGSRKDDIVIEQINCVAGLLAIPNIFSPNGDGVNDTWMIPALQSYDGCIVTIFNRYGQPVFSSVGYKMPGWNGIHNSKPLPVSTYYYVIDLKNGTKPLGGHVTIIR